MVLEPVLDMVRVMQEYRKRGIPTDNVYLLDRENWIDARCIGFEIDDLTWADAHEVSPGHEVPFIRDRPLLFLVHRDDPDRRSQLRVLFPEGEERLVAQNQTDRDYYVYFVPRPGDPSGR